MSLYRNQPAKRQKEIISILKRYEVADVNFLMGMFGASRATITRDVNSLIGKGLIKRSYGDGLTLAKSNILEDDTYSFDSSRREFLEEKRAIARGAFSLFRNGDTVVLNPGVTTFEIARLIADSDLELNIITNSVMLNDLFSGDLKRRILLLGGELLHGGHMVSGPIAIENMKNLQGDIAVIGVHGIDIESGLSLPYSEEAVLEAHMLQRCKRKVIVADHVKFGRACLYALDAELKDIDVIITDDGTDKGILKDFEKLGIRVMRCG